MRIAIDGTCWLNRRGYGRFARELVHELVVQAPEIVWTLVTDFDPAAAPAPPAGVRVQRVATGTPAARAAAATGRRSVADMWAVSRALSGGGHDLIFFPSAYTYVPVFGRSRVAVVIHDVIAEQLPEQVFPTRRAAWFWRAKLWAARRQADLILTVSEASRTALAGHFGIPPGRIVVVPEGPGVEFQPCDPASEVLAQYGLLGQRFVLYVGGISPHKNLVALVDAFADVRSAPAPGSPILVMVGDYQGDVFHSAYAAVRGRAADRGVADAVRFTGYVPDADLAHLYNAAAVLVLPSLLEGFGLPVVEAMACGTPVVVSNRGALPEVVGDAGIVCDPDRPGALAGALRTVLDDAALHARLRTAGLARAAQFSWTRAARVTLDAFRRLSAD